MPPTRGLTPSLGPWGPTVRGFRIQLYLPVGAPTSGLRLTHHQAAQAPLTSAPTSVPELLWPHSQYVKTQPTHQQANTTTGLLCPWSQMCQDPALPASCQQPPQKVGPGHQPGHPQLRVPTEGSPPQHKGQKNSHRGHFWNLNLWWLQGSVLLGPIRHFLYKATIPRSGNVTNLLNKQK